jgi:chromosome segregation ATPase
MISTWNEKVISAIQEDAAVRKKLDPLLAEITSLQSDQKTNRKRIAELKDQCSELEKERKRLGQKIKKDSSDLAKTLDDRCKDVLGSLEERLEDITENIKYLYQDSFTYRII